MSFAARFDLGQHNISFDFYAWQAHAVQLGATQIVFDRRTWGRHRDKPEVLEQRYRSIIAPGPAMLGLPSREGSDGIDCLATHRLTGLLANRHRPIPRLKSVLPPDTVRYTVTLRNCPKFPERNSAPFWRDFACEIGAVVIEDWHDQPLDLHVRMSLYAGARMNFGVVNGPMGMLMMSAYPLQMWGCNLAVDAWGKHGIPPATQVPFFKDGQSLVWHTPTMAGLIAAANRIERTC